MHGVGVFTYADGSEFFGTWVNGIPHGEGLRCFPDSSSC